MAWPNVRITVGYVYYLAADLAPYINMYVGHDYAGMPDPFLLDGMTGAWDAPPAIAGNIYNDFASFETAWYSANVGNTPITMTYPHFANPLTTCDMDFPAGAQLEWGTAWSVGDLQTFIEAQAAGALQTPEQYLAAQDAGNRALWGGLPDPGYCYFVSMQEALVSPSPAGVITTYFDGIGIPPDDVLGDCPQTFEAGICPPMAVFFIQIMNDQLPETIPQHKITVSPIGLNRDPERNKK